MLIRTRTLWRELKFHPLKTTLQMIAKKTPRNIQGSFLAVYCIFFQLLPPINTEKTWNLSKMCFLASEGSTKGYSVNRSESTLVLVRRKQDEDKTPVFSAILNRFDFLPKTHCSSGDCNAIANSKKNRNIKTHLNDYPLLSFVSTNFCFKTM